MPLAFGLWLVAGGMCPEEAAVQSLPVDASDPGVIHQLVPWRSILTLIVAKIRTFEFVEILKISKRSLGQTLSLYESCVIMLCEPMSNSVKPGVSTTQPCQVKQYVARSGFVESTTRSSRLAD